MEIKLNHLWEKQRRKSYKISEVLISSPNDHVRSLFSPLPFKQSLSRLFPTWSAVKKHTLASFLSTWHDGLSLPVHLDTADQMISSVPGMFLFSCQRIIYGFEGGTMSNMYVNIHQVWRHSGMR